MKRFPFLSTLFIILLLAILFACLIYLSTNRSSLSLYLDREHFDLLSDIEIVVSRYNENLEWTKDVPFSEHSITVYNKGPNDQFEKPPNIKRVVPVENVGRCDHTYLHHIVKNYDNLAEITVFLPGSCNMENKKEKATKLLQQIKQNKTAVFINDGTHKDIKTELHDFHLDEWVSSDMSNKNVNPEKSLEKSPIRPYGKWYKSNFGDLTIRNVTYMGIFSVSKQDILQHPLDYYKRLMVQLETSSNPEVGHYVERSWAAIFHPMNNAKII